jgi:hypothetical protein
LAFSIRGRSSVHREAEFVRGDLVVPRGLGGDFGCFRFRLIGWGRQFAERKSRTQGGDQCKGDSHGIFPFDNGTSK